MAKQEKYKCYLQHVESLPDVEEEVGEVNLEQAIQAFNDYPWEEQLEKADKRAMTSTLPTISFKSDENRILGIWTKNNEHFELHYENETHYSDFSISYDLTINQEGFSVEDFIVLFFEDKVETYLTLKKKKERQERRKANFILRLETKHQGKFFIPILVWLLVDSVAFYATEFNELLFPNIMVLLLWLIPTLLYVNYWIINKDTVVEVKGKNANIKFSNGQVSLLFTRMDVASSKLVVTRSFLAPWSLMSYLRITLKGGEVVFLTSLLGEIEAMLNGLDIHYQHERSVLPFLLKIKSIESNSAEDE